MSWKLILKNQKDTLERLITSLENRGHPEYPGDIIREHIDGLKDIEWNGDFVFSNKHSEIKFHPREFFNTRVVSVDRFFTLMDKEKFIDLYDTDFEQDPDIEDLGYSREQLEGILASFKALNWFLENVPAGQIETSRYSSGNWMAFDVGESRIIVNLTPQCSNRASYWSGEYDMCLSPDEQGDAKSPADRWLTYYMLYSSLSEMDESEIEQMADKQMIPDVIWHASVGGGDLTCSNCGTGVIWVQLNDPGGHEECDYCGAMLDKSDYQIEIHEGDGIHGTVEAVGIGCPYGHQVNYHDGSSFYCDEHGVNIINENKGAYEYEGLQGIGDYRIYNGRLFNDNTYEIRDMRYETLRELFTFEEMVDDPEFREYAFDAYNYQLVDGQDDIYYSDIQENYYNVETDEFTEPQPEKFEEMKGHIRSSGIEVEFDEDMPFAESLSEVIERVKEMIAEGEEEEEEPNYLKDAKNLLLELESMEY